MKKHWSARRMVKEFPNRAWSQASISRLIKQIDADGTTGDKPGNGRPKFART